MDKSRGVWCGALGIVTGLLCAGIAQAQVNPPSAARAASQPRDAGNPTVQAAQDTRAPTEARPEKRPVPQLTVPLKRRGSTADTPASSAARPEVDDEVARCRASELASERAACSALTKGRKPVASASPGG
jgi:hypothetical protein